MSYIKLEDLRKFPFRLNSNEFNLGAEAVIEYAENLPTADVEVVRHARWLDGRCTNCGHEALDYIDETPCGCCAMRTYITKYCPECGAKMDRGKE